MRRAVLLLAVVFLLGAACGGGGELSGDEQGDVSLHGHGVVAASLALAAVDQTMELDPTLDPQKTPQQNADAIRQRATDGGACVAADLAGATVTVTFASGCAVRGLTLAGQLSLTVTQTGGTITVVASFASLAVGGVQLDGSVQLMTTGDGTYQVTYDLTTADATVAGDVSVAGTTGAVTVSGTLSAASGGRTVSATLADLAYAFGDCYPSGGTATITSTRFSGTITFLPTTPQDGEVTVAKGRLQTTMPLPAYGGCPPG